MRRAEIYFVPGFLGFRTLEKVEYLAGVPSMLEAFLAAREVDAKVHVLTPLPAAHVARRAQGIAEAIAALHDPAVDAVHFVGHSTGGLDIRLLLSAHPVPGFALPTIDGVPFVETRIAAKVRTVTTLATPHQGTPVAPFLCALGLPALLSLLGFLADAKRPTYRGMVELARIVAYVARILPRTHLPHPWLAYVAENVLEPFVADPEDPSVRAYLDALASETGTLLDLAPRMAARFDAGVRDLPGVRYRSFATCVPRGIVLRPMSPAVFASTQLYQLLRLVTATASPSIVRRVRTPEVLERFREDLGFIPRSFDNDGLVPTWSQVHGELAGAYFADHLDVVGMFPHYVGHLRFVGWIDSGSSFRTPELRDLWGRVADGMAQPGRELGRTSRPPRAMPARPSASAMRPSPASGRPTARRPSRRPPA